MPGPESEHELGFDHLAEEEGGAHALEVPLESVRGSLSSLVAKYNIRSNAIRIDSRLNFSFWLELDAGFILARGNQEVQIPSNCIKGRIRNPYGIFFPGSRRIIVRSRDDSMFFIEIDLPL